MNIALNKITALIAFRQVRPSLGISLSTKRVELAAPSPSPATRWSRKALDQHLLDRLGISFQGGNIDVAVPNQPERVRVKGVTNTTYSAARHGKSFISMADGLSISSPELLFAEMGGIMAPVPHLIFGLEICGCFSRSALDPRDGETIYHVRPATSAAAIRAFLGTCSYVSGISQAKRLAPFLMDNAWSPVEAIIAALGALGLEDFGYGMGALTLNPRLRTPGGLMGLSTKESRVPDMLFSGTTVGLNYDGGMHFDLEAIADAATERGEGSDELYRARGVDDAIRAARSRIVDDKRRDRDLWVRGLTVLPVTSEDLYQPGGLDLVMGQIIEAIERTTGLTLTRQRMILEQRLFARRRQRLLWSLLPGVRGRKLSRELGGTAIPKGYVVDDTIEL